MYLILVTPDAEPLVGAWRAEHDGTTALGIPAHVTVRTPFLGSAQWDDLTLSTLETVLPFELTLSHLEDRAEALVIVVEPDDGLRRLTDLVSTMWPELPPHKGGRADLAYHVTVVRTADEHVRAEAWAAMAPALPLRVTGTELWALEGSLADGMRHTVVARSPRPPSEP